MSQRVVEEQLRVLEGDVKEKRKRNKRDTTSGVVKVSKKNDWESVKSEVNMEGRIEKLKKKRDVDKRVKQNIETLTKVTVSKGIVQREMAEALALLQGTK